MKYSCIWILSIVFANCAFAQTKSTVTKHALIVAIGDYPAAGGWGQISGNKDVPYLKQAFTRQGFQESNILTLIDSQATKTNIESALKTLLSSVKKGDVLVIHFSTHGEQIEDDNGDEVDGLDESIVTYNAVAPSKSKDFKNDSAAYFRDDLFGKYILAFRQILGLDGDVVVFIDACHSGSGTRGNLKSRGGEKPFVSSKFQPKTSGDAKGVFNENAEENANQTGLASYIVFSAARAEELAFEVLNEDNQSMGSLSYSMSKVFDQMEPGMTYRAFFSRIQSVLNSKVQGQHPVMEGSGMDRQLFGGSYVQQRNFAEIDKFIGPNQFDLNAGQFAGLNVGAKVVLMPAGTQDPMKGMAFDTGVVISAGSYKSTIKTNKMYKAKPANTWVFVTEPVYRVGNIVLKFKEKNKDKNSLGFIPTEIDEIKVQIKDMPQFVWEGEAEIVLKKGPEKDSILVNSNGYYFAGVPHDNAYFENLKLLLRQYSQYKFLRELTLRDSMVNVEVMLVPVVNEVADTQLIHSKIINGIYTYSPKDMFTIWVKNHSTFPVFINILDLQPDGRINAILPNREAGVYEKDLQIPAGQSRLFTEYIIGVGAPYGMEVYKIFISKKMINLEDLVVLKNPAMFRGNFGVLEKLAQTSIESTRGSNVSVKTTHANGSVQDLVFEIVPE